MSDADLTCPTCEGRPVQRFSDRPTQVCEDCEGAGRRLPTLAEWDALRDERDRLRSALRPVMRRYQPLWGTRETWTGGLAGPDEMARWLDALGDAEVRAELEAKDAKREPAGAALGDHDAKETPHG